MNRNPNSSNQNYDETIYGIDTIKEGHRVAFLANIKTATIVDEDLIERSVLSLYMIEQNGQVFHAYLKTPPYFYIYCKEEYVKEMMVYLEKRFEKKLSSVELVEKIDLDEINYLSGKVKKYIKLNFRTTNDLVFVRGAIKARLDQTKNKQKEFAIEDMFDNSTKRPDDLLDSIEDLREFDILYHIRVCIDKNIRTSKWYSVTFKNNYVHDIVPLAEQPIKPELRVLAFDIETTKEAMKFPDSRIDSIMMISYVVDGDAFLITNRKIISQDIENFEYTPMPEYESNITVFNEPDEASLLDRFFAHIREIKPMVFVTYNGDFFDWPFVEARAKVYGMDIHHLIGIYKTQKTEKDVHYFGRYVTHMDCLHWVNRDSYLPQGSRGLKYVSKSKLGYNPIELDPEDMLPLASSDPQLLSQYSVSDSIATYYLYKKHIHDFIYALCTIIPMFPDEVLRAGSGTLCENLLMAAAYEQGIIFPNKKKEEFETFYKGHLLNNETYIGGTVECVNSGVYRNDLPTKFRIEPDAYLELRTGVEKTIEFAIEHEFGVSKDDITNFDKVKEEIMDKLEVLGNVPATFDGQPLIYHLDVASMYPNIILTNRLQPTAIVDDKKCSGCLFNRPENNCKRNLNWKWKGEYFPLTRGEYEQVKINIEYEYSKGSNNTKSFVELPIEEQQKMIRKKTKERSQKIYKQQCISKTEIKEDTVCMRSNSFYVDTIRSFRDRRYDYKEKAKKAKDKAQEYSAQDNAAGAYHEKALSVMFDSLQLAHKVILNSFYGYVMRRGARWYSMEMAAMVTHTGSNIIMDARKLIDKIGKTLELDTDGIWCLFPKGFPEAFDLTTRTGKKLKFSYPCSMLNILVYEKYANPQYQTLADPKTLRYDTRKEMTILFEIDGPYRAMVIPAAREEGKSLKKRYVVYKMNGSIAELKGFELKRRGELKIIKIFQEDLFPHFLDGKTLEECYQSCGAIANRWLDILYKKGEGIDDKELLMYIEESKSLSKTIDEYQAKKGVALTAAKRMAEFLGQDFITGKKLNCFYIISQKPIGTPVSERAIPTLIFNAPDHTKKKHLLKWLKANEDIKWLNGDVKETDMRTIIDWNYYLERLGNSIQKILTIPAALQKIRNPVQRVAYPDWLNKKVQDNEMKFEQKKVSSFFAKLAIRDNDMMEVEEQGEKERHSPEKRSVKKKATGNMFINFKSQNTNDEDEQNRSIVPSSQTSNHGSGQKSKEQMDVYFDMDQDMDQWLKWQKGLWRARRRGEALMGSGQKGTPRNSIGNMWRSHEEHVLSSVWHIVQICETETLGIYRLWVYLDNGQLFPVKVKTRRTFYVNSLLQTDEEGFRIVKKRLPRNKKPFYLYERTLDEEAFVSQFHSFDEFLANPDYEGVYETKVPLDFKLITEVGSVVKLNRNRQKTYNGYTNYIFDMEELQSCWNHDKPYLPDFNIPVLVVSQISMRGKIVWSVFNNHLNEYNFCVVERGLMQNNYKKVVKDILREQVEEDVVLKISVNSFDKEEQAIAYVDQLLQTLKDRNRSSQYFVVLNSNYKMQRLNHLGLKSVHSVYPTMHLPGVDSSDLQFSSLDWQVKGLRQLCLHYLSINESLGEILELCRYAQIPFCNLGNDKLNMISDVIYARILNKANCVSWYSTTGNPEIGGGKVDDAREFIPTDFLQSEVIVPSLSLDYTVEINIELLARNAICASDELKNLEKESSTNVDFTSHEDDVKIGQAPKAGLERKMGDDLDETILAKTAFTYLKVMADIWFLDVANHRNEYADRLLGNIQRWVCDEESRFYDIMVHKTLNILMKRFYRLLLQRLKTWGARVIYASTTKVIIGTGKYSFSEAENFTHFILKTLISYPLFMYMNVSPKSYWRLLLFKDPMNFGGVRIVDEEITLLDSEWNIREYLPPRLSNQFLVILADFIKKIDKYLEKVAIEDTAEAAARSEEITNKIISFRRKYIKDILSYHLFDTIPKINETFKEYQAKALEIQAQKLDEQNRREMVDELFEEEAEQTQGYSDDEEEYDQDQDRNAQEEEIKEWDFPQVLGRIPNYKNGPLEFIKFLAHVLTYDEEIVDEVVIMKRNCLRFLGISDFSDEAKYVEPCKKITLTDIVCNSCSNVIEIDVFRDKFFKNRDFTCPSCETKFDERRLETKIIKLLKQYVIFYQIQDLYCAKCKMAKSELLETMCKCSGLYGARQDTPAYGFKMELSQFIRSFEELAIHCDFSLLQDYLLELKFDRCLTI